MWIYHVPAPLRFKGPNTSFSILIHSKVVSEIPKCEVALSHFRCACSLFKNRKYFQTLTTKSLKANVKFSLNVDHLCWREGSIFCGCHKHFIRWKINPGYLWNQEVLSTLVGHVQAISFVMATVQASLASNLQSSYHTTLCVEATGKHYETQIAYHFPSYLRKFRIHFYWCQQTVNIQSTKCLGGQIP